jgi:hypothetical protein
METLENKQKMDTCLAIFVQWASFSEIHALEVFCLYSYSKIGLPAGEAW